ncbi:MAG: chemotaxis protein CheB [Bryobacteraceae bacterium]
MGITATGAQPAQETVGPDDAPSYIVGIGASAGGVESLDEFFENMSSESGMAFIVVQHLSSTYRSLMAELLAPRTRMTIYHAETGMRLKPNCIYLNPPKRDIFIVDGRIELRDVDPGQQPPLPIDTFFRSLAEYAGARAIAVVLSGCGTDGSRGIAAIKDRRGTVIVQDTSSAKFDGMPSSAIRTGTADVVGTPEEIPRAILARIGRPPSQEDHDADLVSRGDSDEILALLRSRYNIDFKMYKPAMVQRRIERRLVISRFGTMHAFLEMLRDDPAELDTLYHDFLIGVTTFFRDDVAFNALLPELKTRLHQCQERGDTFRAWVAGCATGEEAYSIAIQLHEAAEVESLNIKIFATDIHGASLQKASAGVYSRDELRNVSEARLERFFTRSGLDYKLAPEIRRSVIFTQHNVLTEAPFAGLDLVSCRNLLIYFEAPAQNKVIAAFNYALKPGGLLFLGSSESIGDLVANYDVLDQKAKLFRKRPESIRATSRGLSHIGDFRMPAPLPSKSGYSQPEPPLVRAYEQLLHRYVPPSLLVNERGELLHAFGDATKLLHQREGRATLSVLELVEDELRVAIGAGLQQVVRKKAATTYEGIRISGGEGEQLVRLTIEPLGSRARDEASFLLTVEPLRPALPMPVAPHEFQVPHESLELIASLEQELQYTKEHLHAVVEEIEVSNEELQSANEELVSANEELQSTNEELHSVNEELCTVNDEFKIKIEELTELTHDMENLLGSTDVGVIFLDRDLRIRRFTPAIAQSFNLMNQDIGRPIDHISHRLQYDALLDDIRTVMRTNSPVEVETRDQRGTPLFMRLLPYRTPAGVSGVVLTVLDISPVKTAEEELRESEERFRCLVEHLDTVYWMTGASGTEQLYESPSFRNVFGRLNPPGHGPRSWMASVLPEDSERATSFDRRDPAKVWEAEYRVLVDFSTRWIRERAFPVFDSAGKVHRVVGFAEDITARKQEDHSRRLTQFAIDRAADCVFWVGENGRFVYCNESGANLLGYRQAELAQCSFDEFHRPQDGQLWYDFLHGHQNRDSIHIESTIRDRSATLKPVELNANRVNVDGERYICIIMRDVSERNRRFEILEQMNSVLHQNRELDNFARIASHDLKEPLRAVLTFVSLLEEDLGGDINDQARKDLDHIRSGATRMQRLINDLLELSRAGSADIEFRQFPLGVCVNWAVESLAGLRNELNPEIHIDALPDVYGDRTLISQLFLNLIGNALKFVDGRKPVIEITSEHDGAEWVFGVSDNGIGMKPEHLEMIFQPFRRVSSLKEGTGIGLAICRKIVERHGGRIWAESSFGNGSHFRFTLTHRT